MTQAVGDCSLIMAGQEGTPQPPEQHFNIMNLSDDELCLISDHMSRFEVAAAAPACKRWCAHQHPPLVHAPLLADCVVRCACSTDVSKTLFALNTCELCIAQRIKHPLHHRPPEWVCCHTQAAPIASRLPGPHAVLKRMTLSTVCIWAAVRRAQLLTSNACWMVHFKALLCIEIYHPYGFPEIQEDQDALLQLWTSRQCLRSMHPEAFDPTSISLPKRSLQMKAALRAETGA